VNRRAATRNARRNRLSRHRQPGDLWTFGASWRGVAEEEPLLCDLGVAECALPMDDLYVGRVAFGT
jgi:hypothetical protein